MKWGARGLSALERDQSFYSVFLDIYKVEFMVMAGSGSSAKPYNILREGTPTVPHALGKVRSPAWAAAVAPVTPW